MGSIYGAGLKTRGPSQVQRILSLKPDIVLADGVLHKKIIEELQNNGVKALAFAPSSVDDIFLIMSQVARVCGAETSARPVISSLRERVHKLSRKPSRKKPRVFRLMSTDPFVTPGPCHFNMMLLRLPGPN